MTATLTLGLAVELARPVRLGWLPIRHAEAALAAAAARHLRAGRYPAGTDPWRLLAIDRQILRLHLDEGARR